MDPLSAFWNAHAERDFHPEDQRHIAAHRALDWSPAEAKRNEPRFPTERAYQKRLHRRLFPQPFAGDLQRASVYLLFGNPGFSFRDYEHDYENQDLIGIHRANLRGQMKIMSWLHPDAEGTPPNGYWKKRLRPLAADLSKETGRAVAQAMDLIGRSMAVVESCPYHSKKDPGEWAHQLPSSRVAHEFVRSFVQPRARDGDALIVVWRGAKAGTGKGSLYLHFESKQSVYIAVVEASLERFVAAAASLVDSRDPVPTRLRSLVELTIHHYGRDELLSASLFGNSGLVDGEVARTAADLQRARIRNLLRELLIIGQRDGTIRANVDVDAASAVLFEIGWAVVRTALEGDSQIPLERALTTLNQIVGLGLLPRSE